MKALRSLLSLLISILIMFSLLFGLALFMESGWSRYPIFAGMGLWYLLAVVFVIGALLRLIGKYVAGWQHIVGEGIFWSGRLIQYWLLITIVMTVLIRLDFSIYGAAHAFFFLLWPTEQFLTQFSASSCFFVTLGFLLLLITAIGITLQLRGDWNEKK